MVFSVLTAVRHSSLLTHLITVFLLVGQNVLGMQGRKKVGSEDRSERVRGLLQPKKRLQQKT